MNEYRITHYKTPRSMEEAFGPYARLETKKDSLAIRFLNYVAAFFR